jgi:hypothetical protein
MLVEYSPNNMLIFKFTSDSDSNNQLKKIKNFIEEKKKFDGILNIYKKKILFPKEFIHDIGKIYGLEYLYHYILGYNSFIKEARYLSKELKKVSSWGYFLNSYNSWNNSVNSISVGIEKYQVEILNFITKKSELIIQSLDIKYEYSYWLSKFLIFMSVTKDYTNPNKFMCVINFDQANEFHEISLDQVKKLLPLFSNSKSNGISNKLKNIYYEIPDLFVI